MEVDDSPVQVSADKRSDVSRPQDRIFGDSSTVMGAITLLGFLNLLGYIQVNRDYRSGMHICYRIH